MEFVNVTSSGEEINFSTGAKRDASTGKGRFDLITPIGLKRLAKHYENGCKSKYEPRNWEKGIPLMRYLDSAERHLNDYKECLLTGDEPAEDHLAAVAWNVLGFIHTEEMIRRGKLSMKLDDRPSPPTGNHSFPAEVAMDFINTHRKMKKYKEQDEL